MKSLSYSLRAAKDLRRIGDVRARIIKTIEEYALDQQAHANNVKRLAGSTAKRLRVGDYRVIFEENEASIIVTKIGPRGGVYD